MTPWLGWGLVVWRLVWRRKQAKKVHTWVLVSSFSCVRCFLSHLCPERGLSEQGWKEWSVTWGLALCCLGRCEAPGVRREAWLVREAPPFHFSLPCVKWASWGQGECWLLTVGILELDKMFPQCHCFGVSHQWLRAWCLAPASKFDVFLWSQSFSVTWLSFRTGWEMSQALFWLVFFFFSLLDTAQSREVENGDTMNWTDHPRVQTLELI